MREFIHVLSLILLFVSSSFSQNLEGYWRGALIPNGMTIEKGSILQLDISINQTEVEGISRDELYGTETFALKNIKGTFSENKITFKQTVITKKTSPSKTNWCKMDAELTYNSKTGYLEGTYKSNDCRNVAGKIILYKTDIKPSREEKPSESHVWYDILIRDLKKGLSAPEIRKIERDNFVFKPIYFDYDKAEILPEFNDFLNSIIRIVEGHSDLRVKVVGHTDADGSDAYNDELSKRRAEAIIGFFVARGLSRDRIEIDFKGEKNPVGNNSTPEGKQKNRRVDFSFI